jgi:hypothetical protein
MNLSYDYDLHLPTLNGGKDGQSDARPALQAERVSRRTLGTVDRRKGQPCIYPSSAASIEVTHKTMFVPWLQE